MERLNDNINESIKRTNDIFSNQFRSDKFVPQPVVIEPRADFIDNFSKVKLRKVCIYNNGEIGFGESYVL